METLTIGGVESKFFEEKKEQVADRLQKREDARLAELEKKKADKDSKSAAHEKSAYFSTAFNECKLDIEAKVARSESLPSNLLPAHFDSIARDYNKLQKFLADSTLFLPTYDIRMAQEALKTLQDTIRCTRDHLLPKKKFAFKANKKKALGKDLPDLATDVGKKDRVIMEMYECDFRDLSDQKLYKSPEDVDRKDVGLRRLQNCEVRIEGTPSTVHMNGLKRCTVLCGPVSTSVFIEECEDCTFVVACQQLRVHSTKDSNVYLHVTTRAIIEDCSGLRFAPYNWTYAAIGDHFSGSGLDRTHNNWQCIDDFNWLASDVASPNWSVLDEAERKKAWDL